MRLQGKREDQRLPFCFFSEPCVFFPDFFLPKPTSNFCRHKSVSANFVYSIIFSNDVLLNDISKTLLFLNLERGADSVVLGLLFSINGYRIKKKVSFTAFKEYVNQLPLFHGSLKETHWTLLLLN